MLLLTHILLALSSIAWATYLLIKPSKTGLHVSVGLLVSTLISGTVLTIASHAPILQACISGLCYSAGSGAALIIANRKLQTPPIT